MTLTDLLRLHFVENPGCGERHRADYMGKLAQFRRWLGHEPTHDDLMSDVISRYLTEQYITPGRSATTANNHRRFLLCLAGHADREGLLDRPPRVKQFRAPKRNPKAFMVDQIRRLIAACRKAPSCPRRVTSRSLSKVVGAWTGADWELLLRLIAETGNRPGCLLTVRFRDIDANGWCRVIAEETKTSREKLDRLSPDVLALIDRRYHERDASPDDRILHWRMGEARLHTTFRRDVIIPAGLQDESLSLYGILKWATSEICKAEGEYAAMRFRGHTNVEMTRRYIDPRIAYTHVAACEILPRI